MHLLTPDQYRALEYVRALNKHGLYPSTQDIDAFVSAGDQLMGLRRVGFSQRVSDVLQQGRLILLSDGVAHLSPAGAALLAEASESPAPPEAPVEVAGRMSDPFFYAHVLTQIDGVERALVVDPYLPSRDLPQLLRLSSVERVLTLDSANGRRVAGEDPADRKRKLGLALGARPEVKLRFAQYETRELHDRVVLPRSGAGGLMLGTSTGGTQMTVITRLSDDTSAVLLAHYDALWASATELDAIGREPDPVV